jgi:hypothetical protein
VNIIMPRADQLVGALLGLAVAAAVGSLVWRRMSPADSAVGALRKLVALGLAVLAAVVLVYALAEVALLAAYFAVGVEQDPPFLVLLSAVETVLFAIRWQLVTAAALFVLFLLVRPRRPKAEETQSA